MSIILSDINKYFGESKVLDNINLEIESGDLVALLGPSGSGKTTLLRLIAGLEFPNSGHIILNNEDTSNKNIWERRVGFVFQHYALFKHLTVFENVAFGLRLRSRRNRPSESDLHKKIMNLLKMVQISELVDRFPYQLSGGQRQRVALARTLAIEPKILLLDEPFGALDAKVRKELRRWIRRLHDEMNVTSVFVTHDQEEAMEVADKVVVMSHGCIEQVGTPDEVYCKPANAFVYDFLGDYNEFDAWEGEDGKVRLAEYETFEEENYIPQMVSRFKWLESKKRLSGFLHRLIPYTLKEGPPIVVKKSKVVKILEQGRSVKIFARPHEIELVNDQISDEYIEARVVHVNQAGPLVKIELERKDLTVLQAQLTKEETDSLKVKRGKLMYLKPKIIATFE